MVGPTCCGAVPGVAGNGIEMGEASSFGDAEDRSFLPPSSQSRAHRAGVSSGGSSHCDSRNDGARTGSDITSACPSSTVERILHRYRMPILTHLDQAPVSRPGARSPSATKRGRPGDLIHVDIKKQGRIPDGGGHRMLGRTVGNRNNKKKGRGYAFLHHAVDDHSRLAYSEILDDERKETASAFWVRANAFFAGAGITVREVLTDNGSCYRSRASRQLSDPDIKHRFTKPYRPQTNGRSNASTAPSPRNGPTPRPTPATKPDQRPTTPGSITTITTDPTPASAATHPQTVFTTSRGRTASPPRPSRRAGGRCAPHAGPVVR